MGVWGVGRANHTHTQTHLDHERQQAVGKLQGPGHRGDLGKAIQGVRIAGQSKLEKGGHRVNDPQLTQQVLLRPGRTKSTMEGHSAALG